MEAGALLLLLFASSTIASALDFYGDSVSFMPPRRTEDGAFKVTFHHRQNGRSTCKGQPDYTCDGGVCSFNSSGVLQTDTDNTGQSRWCQSEGQTVAIVSTNKTTFTLRDSGCCWVTNANGKKNWTTHAELDLGTRSDSRGINSCPVTTTVSSLRVPQNCVTVLRLLAYDADADKVRCRFAAGAAVPSNLTLDQAACTLTRSGLVPLGVHVFELVLEDFPRKNLTLTYADGTEATREASNMAAPFCKLKLQFTVEILPQIPNCEAGHVQPMFLSTTPSHGDVLFATVGQKFQLNAQAQAHHSSIHDFQVSGPQNMTKAFSDEANGKARVTLSWTPQRSDLYRSVPVCFTAETNETQSEMRCVIVTVTQASITQGKAMVKCSPNKMEVVLDKASMPGIDENFLKLMDESCSLTSNSTHIMGIMSFSTCGTKVENKGDFIVFKNEIKSFELPSEVIVRRKTVRIDFSCQFPRTISISSYYNLHQTDYIFTESSFGSFGYTFDIYRDSKFTTKVEASAYPVEVKLLEKIYMGIQAQSVLPNVTLFVESCKATPDDNPKNSLSYDLIKNGCLRDETVKVHPSDQTTFNFEVQAFKFTGNYEQVYITCSVILCEPGSPFSRCAQGCLSTPSRRRRRRGQSLETESHYIIQGPLRFIGPTDPESDPDPAPEPEPGPGPDPSKDQARNTGVKESDTPVTASLSPSVSSELPSTTTSKGSWVMMQILTTNVSTAVFAAAFVASLVLMSVVVCYFTKKRRAEDQKYLIESDSEN